MEDSPSGKLSLAAIEAFVAVVEERSISRGAKRLGSSISAVSLRLTNLENALGSKLIERNAQRFAITEAGHLFRRRALKIIDEIDGAKSDLTTRQGSPFFTLRIALVEDFDNHVLPPWLGSLQDAFPNVRFVVKSGPSHENFSILSSRAADLIVAVDAMDPTDWIEEHPLMHDPYILVTGRPFDTIPTIENLAQIPFVRYAREQHMGRQIEAQLRRIKFTPPKQHEFSSNQALFSMVGALRGWTITTVSAVHGTLSHRDLKNVNLYFYKLPIPAFSRTVSLYARKDILSSVPLTAAESLRSCLREVFDPGEQVLPLPEFPSIHG